MKRMLLTNVPFIILYRQYRMHSDISYAVSHFFYNDRLQDDFRVIDRFANASFRKTLRTLFFILSAYRQFFFLNVINEIFYVSRKSNFKTNSEYVDAV